MSENYKILGKYVKDMSSETPDIETFLFVKDHISKYQLNIDINSKALKNKLIEVYITLKFEDKEANQKKSYFEKYYGNGFDYAYKFPGLTKVIQSAGRVFRSNTDRGFVIFMGHRFSTDSYLNYLPTDYDIKFKNIITEINRFWSHN